MVIKCDERGPIGLLYAKQYGMSRRDWPRICHIGWAIAKMCGPNSMLGVLRSL